MEKIHMFIERTLDLIEKKGITKNKLLTDLHLSKNSFVDWQKRGSIPSADVALKIAEYFDVPLDYLMGRTDDPNQKPGESNIKLDEFSYAMYNESKELSDSDKERLLTFARMLRESSEESNDD